MSYLEQAMAALRAIREPRGAPMPEVPAPVPVEYISDDQDDAPEGEAEGAGADAEAAHSGAGAAETASGFRAYKLDLSFTETTPPAWKRRQRLAERARLAAGLPPRPQRGGRRA
jgi:hypothetical protein